MRRWVWFGVGLAASAAFTLLLWSRGVAGFGLFLLFPFMLWPLFKGRQAAEATPARVCPACGWVAQDDEARFCPRDGTRLQ